MAYRKRYEYLTNKEQLQNTINRHKEKGSIRKISKIGKGEPTLNLERAHNELKLAESALKISKSSQLKEELGLFEEDTFYSGTITHAYYTIFFATKALLLKSNIKTRSPNVHKATLDAFAKYWVINSKLDVKLLEIYKSNMVKADTLLNLLVTEREKRGRFTYKKMPDANKQPAEQSLNNAEEFLRHTRRISGVK